MKYLRKYLKFTLLFFALGCSSNNHGISFDENAEHFSEFEENISLSLQTLGVFNRYTPSIILPHDSIIFLIPIQTQKQWIELYSIHQKKVIKRHLKYGRGPNEALSAFSSGISNDSLWIHDLTLSRIVKYKLEDLLTNDSPPASLYKLSESFYSSKMLNDSILVGSGMAKTAHKLQFYNIYTGELTNVGGTYNIPKSVPVPAAKDALTAYVNVRNSDEGADLALIGRYTDAVEFFDSKNNLSGFTIQGPYSFNPTFDIGTRNKTFFMKKRADTKKAYVNSIATQDNIYALYSGGLRNEGRKWAEGQFLHVFDWQGTPKASYNLGKHVYGYGIDGHNNRIYVYSEENGEILYANL